MSCFHEQRTGPFRLARCLKRDEIRMNRHRALAFCLSMIFSENRCTLFRIMLYAAFTRRAFFARTGNLLSTENPTFIARMMVAIVSKRGLAPGASVL